MRLIYFDEVKDNDTNQEHFWMGGISLKAESVRSIEAKVTTISRRCFDDPHLKKSTEFHAADIYHRKRAYKSWVEPGKRVALIGELLRILDDDNIDKIYVRISREYCNAKFSAKKIDEVAFMFFCEKANELMRQQSDLGMLIGDRENGSIASKYAERLSNWREYKTDYDYGGEISHLIDTVHFTESHLSRMLQLADIHIWCRQFINNKHDDQSRASPMIEEIRNCGRALFARKYRKYPNR